MACFTEWGGVHEIEAMSLMYERDVIIFDGHTLTKNSVARRGKNKFIFLCYTSQKQYESVYTQEFISTAAYCQCRFFTFDLKFIHLLINKYSTYKDLYL